MSRVQSDRVIQLLSDLIALRTVNPMGRPYSGTSPVERPVIEYLERLFAPYSVAMVRQTSSPIHESLLITVPGRDSLAGCLFESHIDTVPADDWADRAFSPRIDAGKIYGRGACDDKGSLAAMVLALLQILESKEPPPQTIWLLAAGDEEHAQTGIRHFMANQHIPISRAIIGEPTGCIPVIQQKGVIRWDITVQGRSAHTSQAEQGNNAILSMLRVIQELTEHEEELRRRYTSPLMTGPSLTVTMIQGGRTRNMVPDECTVAVDFRILPQMDRQQAIADVRQRLSQLEISLSHSDFQVNVPGIQTSPDAPLVQSAVQICSSILGRNVQPAGVPYGSDACYLPAATPTIVLGPGSIDQAHAVDEYVELEQVMAATEVYLRLMRGE
ncbi:MAG: ArgE/DapE family deacylase [Planctomycetota bacterium]|nr:ArgE/DapE family deacylase [Planctomycetota bacterium]